MRKTLLLSRFSRKTNSAASIEFAILAPVMIIMFLGTVELTLVIRLQHKLSQAAGQYAELIAGQSAVTEGSFEGPGGTLGDMCTGVSYDLLPFNPANLSAFIESTTVKSTFFGPATGQDWANDQSYPSSHPEGSFWETILLTSLANTPYSMFTQNGVPPASGGTLVVGYSAISVQLRYDYNNIIPFFLGPRITLTAIGVARPRSNATITCTYGTGANLASCPGVY